MTDRKIAATAGVLALLAAGAGCSRQGVSRPPEGKVQVVASIFPLADIVRRVGGRFVEVHCLVGPGQSPHAFSLQAAQIEQLSRARLIVMVGLGVDDWASPRAGGEGSAAVRRLGDEYLQAPGDRPAAHEGDPHVWLHLPFAVWAVEQIRGELARIDPAHADAYRRQAEAYAGKLDDLDRQYARTLAATRQKRFVTFHKAYSYIADRYGLEQMSLHDADAAGFGAERMERVTAFVADHRVGAIFAEPQFDPRKLQTLARVTGARVGTLDALGNPNVAGYDSYLALMRSNLRSLADALNRAPATATSRSDEG
jgi:ABC-type Zn uptake system ZnuABC Zn-binding protein ZnuA